MKKRTKSNFLVWLQSLGIVAMMFFAMAFACHNATTRRDSTTSSDGRCSTEAEFRRIITKKHSAVFGESDGKFQETEVIFQTFRVGAATRYTNAQYSIDASPAYPITTDYTVRDFLGKASFPVIREQNHNVKFICFVDIYETCVCHDESRKSSEASRIPYKR